jgi:hypothetical protein
MDKYSELIPELKDWNNGKGIDVESWIGCVGNFQLMIAYSTLFWPNWKIYKDMIVPENAPEDYLEEWLRYCDGDKRAVESVVSHIHIVDLHHAYSEDVTHDRLIFLGNKLKEIYECKLESDFPERNILVVFDDSPQEDITDYILYIFHDSNAPNKSL